MALLLAGAMLINSQIGVSQAAETTEASTQTTAVAPEEVVKETLSLSKALELGIENNLDLKYAEADRDRTIISASQQSKIAKVDDPTGSYDGDLLIEIGKLNKKLLPEVARKGYETTKMSVELGIKNAYTQLVYAKENYELATKYKEQTDESYQFTQKKFALGQVSNIEVLNAEAEVAVKEAELVQASISYQQKLMDMNMLLNQPLDKEWELDKKVNATIVTLPELETLKSNMEENHPAVLSSNLSFSIAEATFELAKGFYPSNVWTYRYAEQDYYKAKYQHEETLLAQEKNLNQAYVSVEGSIQAIKMYEKSVETISESYRISKIRFDLGMITNHDLNEALLAQQRMESNLLNAKLNYQLAIAQLEFASAFEIE